MACDLEATPIHEVPNGTTWPLRIFYRLSADGPWSPLSADSKNANEALVGAVPNPTPAPLPAGSFKNMPIRMLAEFNANPNGGGEASQWLHSFARSESNPNVILAQDMGQIRAAPTAAEPWSTQSARA